MEAPYFHHYSDSNIYFPFFPTVLRPNKGHGLLIFEDSRSYRTPLDEWSTRHTDLYLTTHNTYKRQIAMPPARFEPTIPASERQ